MVSGLGTAEKVKAVEQQQVYLALQDARSRVHPQGGRLRLQSVDEGGLISSTQAYS